VSTAPSSVVAGGRAARAPRGSGGSGLRTVHRAVARLTVPVLLLLPALTVMVGLVGWPLVRTIWLSFTDTRLGDLVGSGTGPWSGLDNYHQVFTDEHLRASLVNTVLFGSVCVIGTMIFGFVVALLLQQRLRANALFGIAVLLPWAVPAIAASAIWRWLFDARYGFVNWALTSLGFDRFQDYAWFASKGSAYTAIFVTVVWQSFPFIALSLLAGLQTVPKDVLDAAAVDGASATQRFRLVTLPLLRPIIAVLVVFSTIWDFRIFDQVYVMAQGVPDRAADTAAVTAYRESFALGHYGVGAAIAVVLFGVLLALSLLYVRLIGREGEV
jgi:N,N'-diacetylchitobiose transport system permease protein